MDECLRLGCANVFGGVHADRLVAEPAGAATLRMMDENLLLFSARGVFVVAADPGHVVLYPSEAIVIPECHREIVIECSPEAELYLLYFRQAPAKAGGPYRRLEIPDHVAVLRPARLTHLLRRVMDEARRPAPSHATLHHLVALSLLELARSSATDARGGAGDVAETREAALESIASRVDAYIAAHYHEPIATPDIARELHYNPAYLERAYHLERRMSIREAVHARRIREVRAQLLLQRGKAVAEIAALCGYPDPAYFRRVFKRATNMTPRGYRRVHDGELVGSATARTRG